MGRLRAFVVNNQETAQLGLAGCAGLAFIGGAGTLVYQLLLWLKHGRWETFTVSDAVYKYLPDSLTTWVLHPTDWVGVAEVVLYVLLTPLWAVLIILTFPLFYLALVVGNLSEGYLQAHQANQMEDESLKPVEEASGAELLRRIEDQSSEKGHKL